MTVLLDTNIVLRLAQPQHEMHSVARDAITRLSESGIGLRIVPQTVYEYWAVATRPVQQNGLGMSVREAVATVSSLLENLPMLEDEYPVFWLWRRLVVEYEVRGKRSHDAKLVAAMLHHDIRRVLTFNDSDFRRFQEIEVLVPGQIVNSSPA